MSPFAGLRLSRRHLMMSSFASAFALAGCRDGIDAPGSGPSVNATPGLPPVGAGGLGTGSVKVALILPLSAGGQSSQIGGQLKNAADLALREFGGADIQLLVKDDQGTTEGGQAAASGALGEGAQLILGPLNTVTSRGAAGPARQAGVPMIAFTTDVSIATRGVYLIGFLPNADVERVVTFAAQQGRKSAAGLIPEGAYGSLTEGTFRQVAATAGMRIQAIEHYKADGSDLAAIAQNVARLGGSIDCVFIPDGINNTSRAVSQLAAAGLDRTRVKILGTGLLNDAAAFNDPVLAGTWFPAPDPDRVNSFKTSYRQAFGQEPGPLAVLGYEAVFLAAGLIKSGADKPFRDDTLLSRNGFFGNTGVFRFRPDGMSERGLAVLEIGAGVPKIVSPAPRQFVPGA